MRTFAAAIAVIVAFAGLVVYAPAYLLYADPPQKADAVVLFLGNEYKERRAEAIQLMGEGYASYLVIPAYGRVAQAHNHGDASRKVVPSRPPHYPIVYEDTHIEIIEAKKLMDTRGLSSAIFVSSPHHMRRIKLITDRVFPRGSYRTTFVPTRFERRSDGLWFFHESEIKKVTSEYGKILWFFLYRWMK
ncbi:MAG: ElyC/SanA/YdcF family protein [Syntrophorhabdaceae bacterium]|nr:ElyC/SanA/YdcF family protein [Syntrophorhabdaceae bacterium]